MFSENSRTILSRIYISLSVMLIVIANILSGFGLFEDYSNYRKEYKVYTNILALHNKAFQEIEKNPPCAKTADKPHWECTIETLYDKEHGTFANPGTEKYNIISFAELNKPKFRIESLFWLLTTLFLLPGSLMLLKRWAIWVSNIKKVEKSEQV